MSVIFDLVDTRTVLVAFITSLVCFVAVHICRDRARDRGKNLPPSGPREWPLIGCVPSLIGDEPYKLLAGMTQLYGPVFLTRIGMIRTLVLNDYNSIREALVRSGDDFSDRPRSGMIEYITKGLGIISAHVGESQREKRRFGLAALRSLGMGKSRLVENMTGEISNLIDLFKQRRGEPFVPFHDITVSVANIISWITFGKRFEHDDADFKKILSILHEGIEISETTGAVGLIPALQYLPLPVWRKLARFHLLFVEIVTGLIKQSLARPLTEEPCFVQMYCEEMERLKATAQLRDDKVSQCKDDDVTAEQNKTKMFTQDDLFQTIGDFLTAGTDTTATTLSWAVLHLLLYPDVQRKIHVELDTAIGRDRMPALEDRKSLPYTEAVLMEIQRKASIVPLGVPHSTPWDTKLFDYDIPAGILVLPNIWAVHHDPSIWKDPEDFIPERFLNDDRTAVVQREELIQFSTGRRKCLGEQLAKMELYLFFTHLLHCFEFRLPEGAPPPSTKGRPGATRTPMSYEVCAIPRK